LRNAVPTILVIDDTEVVRKSVVRCLRRRGYLVLEARHADEALELLELNGERFDLILSDVVLPTMSGVELIAEARRRFPGIAAAYMTGHLGRSARCEASLEEGTLVLIKPFTPSLLEERVREALAASSIRFGTH
jgi:two-component system cell cycle sensor histidine kinase/response regulator CckA